MPQEIPFEDFHSIIIYLLIALCMIGYFTNYKITLLLTVPFLIAFAMETYDHEPLFSLGLVAFALVNVYIALWRPSEV